MILFFCNDGTVSIYETISRLPAILKVVEDILNKYYFICFILALFSLGRKARL